MVENRHTAGWFPSLYEPFSSLRSRVADWFAPASEASTTEDAYEIEVELPGVKSDDIDVSVDGNVLTIRGEKQSQRTEEGRTWYFTERQFGSFQRTFSLPMDADTDKVSADARDGVLTLRIPKRTQAESGKRIKVGKR